MRSFIIFAILAIALSCTNEDAARVALEGAGYSEIQFHGWSWWRSCGKGDETCTEFTAVGPTGRRVHGAVGCGRGCVGSKGCTVRTF